MKRAILIGSAAVCFCLGLAVPLLAAQPPLTGTANEPSPSEKSVSVTKPAEKCLGDSHAFDSQMEKDGYWLGGSGYGYGYPMGGYGYPMDSYPAGTATG